MYKLLLGVSLVALLSSCGVEDAPNTDQKQTQAAAGARKANDVLKRSGGQNSEQDNIARRLSLTMNPGQIGFVALFNEAGAPIAYYGVKGKITSSGKRLTNPQIFGLHDCGEYRCTDVVDAPSDEGTYGHSDPYMFFWTTDDQYVQWNGPYLYSDKPFRLRTEPLVISVAPSK